MGLPPSHINLMGTISLIPVNTGRSPSRVLFACASRFGGNRSRRYFAVPMAAASAAARSNSHFASGRTMIPDARAAATFGDAVGWAAPSRAGAGKAVA